MTPSTIIQSSAREGVTLALSPSGTIKASGDQGAVSRWLPVVREHKSAIIKTLLANSACTGDLGAIREWLAYIGEHDPATISCVLDKCCADSEAMDYFMRRSVECTGKGALQ
jgi:hypothetical protein